MQNIFIVSFDGLHNTGKGTQITLLSKQLNISGVSTLIRRGDGMRKGSGDEDTDPESSWWKDNIARMRATGFEGDKSMAAATEAANRLNAEIFVAKNHYMPNLMKREGRGTGIILLDRGPISRLFVKRREESQADLDSIRFFENRSGKHEILLPDQIFLLHAPLDVLISRNFDRTSEKSKFNETVLTRYYGDFVHTMTTLPTELSERTIYVDSTKSILEINNFVRFSVSKLTGISIVEGNFTENPERR
jgi:thymidylate kinase